LYSLTAGGEQPCAQPWYQVFVETGLGNVITAAQYNLNLQTTKLHDIPCTKASQGCDSHTLVQTRGLTPWIIMSSGFRREVAENCALLGYYALCNGNYLPTFREKYRSHLHGSRKAYTH
jgi:hypothetical protein